MLTLEGAQAGLSWETILKRREGYRRAFDGFDIERIAAYDEDDRARLLADPGIIRNRPKVNATIGNAQAALAPARGRLAGRLLLALGGRQAAAAFPRGPGAATGLDGAVGGAEPDLVRRGFKFVGPTIMYAFMQASGMVNDHLLQCFRYKQLGGS